MWSYPFATPHKRRFLSIVSIPIYLAVELAYSNLPALPPGVEPGNLPVNSRTLCQLSYGRLRTYVLERLLGIEPRSSVWKTEALPLSYSRKRQSHHPVELTNVLAPC